MEMIINTIIVIVGWALTAWTLAYGCMRVKPGSFTRWAIFLASGVVSTQFGWLPLLPFLGLRVTAADQYMAVVLATVGLKLLMERALPWLLWSVDVEEVSE
jgi:hypothetical protein